MLNAPEPAIRSFISTQYDPGNSRDIQVLCPYSDLEKVFDRIKRQWVQIGQVEPYASVLSEEKYTSGEIEKNFREFHETGIDGIKVTAR